MSDDRELLARRFEEHRPHLRAVAYRMLGSLAEVDDAVQATWERASRAGADDVENLKAWLTTIVSRVCLNMLRSRRTKPTEPLEGSIPDPIVTRPDALDPEAEVLLADSVGLALQVVIETLSPPERLAFVLHDIFDVPFEEIGPVVGRTPQAARQLASRARRRVRGAEPAVPEPDTSRQRAVLDAFYAAARAGDLDAIVGVLDPDVVLRTDFGATRASRAGVIRWAEKVARQARFGAAGEAEVHPVLVNGAAGALVLRGGQPSVVMAFAVTEDRIVEIDIIADPERVARLARPVLGDIR